MKKILSILTITLIFQTSYSQQPSYDVTAGNGNGLRFWSNDSYKIHMGNSSEYKYGPVTDYSIKMNMNSGAPNRGWTWGVHGVTPVAALSSDGDFQIAKDFRALGNITIDGNNVSFPLNGTPNDPDNYVNKHDFRIRKSNNSFYIGLSNEFNVRKVYLQSGHVGSAYANGTGSISLNPFGGNVGIGTTNPTKLLDVYGDAKIGKLNSRHYQKISSKEWPEIRFETPLSNEKIRIGVAHATNSGFKVEEGDFYVFTATSNTMPLVVNKNGNVHLVNKSGNVGIGTTAPDAKLTVKGKIHAEEVKIDLSVPAPDYVFNKEYELLTIEEVQQYISEKGHLPNIPSAAAMEANGVELGIMNMKLLEKIEELTLYTIEQEKKLKKLETLEKENKILTKELDDQNIRINKLEVIINEIIKKK